jgi:hypothetical protein
VWSTTDWTRPRSMPVWVKNRFSGLVIGGALAEGQTGI